MQQPMVPSNFATLFSGFIAETCVTYDRNTLEKEDRVLKQREAYLRRSTAGIGAMFALLGVYTNFHGNLSSSCKDISKPQMSLGYIILVGTINISTKWFANVNFYNTCHIHPINTHYHTDGNLRFYIN